MADTDQTTDPITALIRLRAAVVRMSHEVDELAEAGTTRKGRVDALSLARRMRDAAMASEITEACKR